MRNVSPALTLLVFCTASFSSLPDAHATVDGSGTENSQPNIVVLFSDDAGFADFGFQPNCRPDMKKLTPHIDSIAAHGVRFSNAYMAGCVCSPSRAGLMTGRYQQRFGHDNNIPPGYMKGGLPLTETFLPKRLQKLGYKTSLIGKWHLGYPDKYQPNKRGFDWFYGCLQGSRSYFPMDRPTPHRVFLDNTKPTPEKGYITDRIGDAACKFIRESRDKPFFIFVSFTAPHGPLQAKPGDLKLLDKIQNQRRRKYAGLVKAMDDNVGKILKAIDEAGIADKTLVVFTNDNGGQTRTGANNAPLRGAKGSLWEGGVRVPMAMRWPGKIKKGSVIDSPVISLDFAPTIINAGGGKVQPDWKLDGVDLGDVLTGKSKKLDNRTLFWRRQGSGKMISARSGKWKLMRDRANPSSKPQLFDLSTDIGESRDLSEEHPQQVKTLMAAITKWEKQLKQPLWGPGSPGYQPAKRRRKKKK